MLLSVLLSGPGDGAGASAVALFTDADGVAFSGESFCTPLYSYLPLLA